MEQKENGKLGLMACIFILAGGCIGSAIFSLSGLTMINGGPASLLTWLIAAVIMVLYGFIVTELAVRYPVSGGVFEFPAKAIGRGCGFFSAWGYIISNIIAVAFSAITVGTFVCAGLSQMTMGAVWQYQKEITLIAALVSIVLASIMNLLDVQTSGGINTGLVIALIAVMLVYVVFAFASPGFQTENFRNFFTGAQPLGWIRSIPNAMVAYGTCVAIAFIVGQVSNPKKNVPRSLIISMILVVILYLLMIVSTVGIVDHETLIAEDGAFQPMFTAINHMGYSQGIVTVLYLILGIAGLLALFTTILVVQMLNARALQSMASAGLMPRFLTAENRHRTPYIATAVLAVPAFILCFFNDVTSLLVNLGSITNAVTIMIVILSFITARKRSGNVDGEYRAPGGVPMAVIAMAVILATYIPSMIASDALPMWIFTAAIYAAGAVLYGIFSKKNNKGNR